ncbi:MAG: ABC transporter permease [Candidatus Sumerlaeia bacterium]|nr:ABC transporter permease [Candidatus Sumerlaeia bacterium]
MDTPAPSSDSTDAAPHEPLWLIVWKRLRRSPLSLLGLAICVAMAVVALAGPALAPHPPNEQVGTREASLAPPSQGYWCGQDDLGRCIFSRLLHGARLTLGAGVSTVLFGMLIGVPLGLASGYFRGWVDSVVMRATDILLAFPDILLALAVMAALGHNLRNAMIAVAIVFIPKFARVARAAALQESGKDYILAARGLGAGHGAILLRHVLPNCLPPLLVISTLSLGTAILYTSALSFLGLGAQPPAPEWGAMLAEGRDVFTFAPHLVLFPGLAIAISVFGVNLLGDGLRDALDVRIK